MSQDIRVALIGIGNCASAFVQALDYYRKTGTHEGLLHPTLGPYTVSDITICCAIDIDKRKVGLDLAQAIYAAPNNCRQITDVVDTVGVVVHMGPLLDGVPPHLRDLVEPASRAAIDVRRTLRDTGTDVVVNMLPTGSSDAAAHYAHAALDAGAAVINGMPARIARDPELSAKATRMGIPIIGDDVKSQFGATIAHRTLLSTMVSRGVHVDRTYQLNYAGNTDFVNLVNRGESKKVTKTAALDAVMPYSIDASAGFAYLSTLGDHKTAEIEIEGRTFGSAPVRMRLTLEVEDSANFGGVIVDAIRSCRLAQDRGIGGILESASAFLMKDPPRAFNDAMALECFHNYIDGALDR